MSPLLCRFSDAGMTRLSTRCGDRHGVNQFLARRNIHGTFKQTWFALFVKTTLSLRDGGVDVTRRIRVPACQMIFAVLDHALHADNIHELIVLTLPPRHRCPLTWLPASRLLLPRSGLEVCWACSAAWR